jgi:hypothetical protein
MALPLRPFLTHLSFIRWYFGSSFRDEFDISWIELVVQGLVNSQRRKGSWHYWVYLQDEVETNKLAWLRIQIGI